MPKTPPGSYLWAEKDWPVLLHVVIAVRRHGRTRAWLSFARTGVVMGPTDKFRVDYTSDARDGSLEAMEDILQTMLKQLRRQRELAQEIQR